MVRVLICDDAVAFGVLFTRWMRDTEVDVVAHASTAVDSLALAREHRPDVIVVDHLLPDSLSSELIPRLRETVPESKIMLISSMPAKDLERAAEHAAADGYLSKGATPEEIRAAITALV